MPRQLFSDEVENRLIELWAEYQRNKSGTMVKRGHKEKEIADKLNSYARELGAEDSDYTALMIHNKIDNLKSKAKEIYRRNRRATSTGNAADDGDTTVVLIWKGPSNHG